MTSEFRRRIFIRKEMVADLMGVSCCMVADAFPIRHETFLWLVTLMDGLLSTQWPIGFRRLANRQRHSRNFSPIALRSQGLLGRSNI